MNDNATKFDLTTSTDSELTEKVGLVLTENFELATVPSLSLDELTHLLAERIAFLLERQPERFMAVLYRIDVSEKRVQEIFKTSGHQDVALDLARLVMDRQLDKIRTREKYRQVSGDDPATFEESAP